MRNLSTITLATSVLFSASVIASTAALAEEKVTPLLNQQLEGLEGMEANIALVEIEPGWETERHIHPGHLFVYVLDGSVEIVLDGEDPVKVSAGEVAYELPDRPMIGRNTSSTEGARIVVFQVGETGKELMIPAPE